MLAFLQLLFNYFLVQLISRVTPRKVNMSSKCDDSVILKPSSPWGTLPSPQSSPLSFTAVMDEEYAKQLQDEEGHAEDHIQEAEVDIFASPASEGGLLFSWFIFTEIKFCVHCI